METRLKKMRTDQNLTQKEVAEAVGISEKKYSQLEASTQTWTLELVIKLAKFYHTSMDYLAERSDDPRPYPESSLE